MNIGLNLSSKLILNPIHTKIYNQNNQYSQNNNFFSLHQTAKSCENKNLFHYYPILFKKKKDKKNEDVDVQCRYDNIEKKVKNVLGKTYQGAGLFDGNYIDFSKVGWENIKNDPPINWAIATDDEILTFRHAWAIAEAMDPWVQKYHPMNVDQPLATHHTLSGKTAQDRYSDAIQELDHYNKLDQFAKEFYKSDLYKLKANKEMFKNALETLKSSKDEFLDEPIFANPDTGEFNTSFTVLDTETTSLNVPHEQNPKFDPDKPDAKIIQLGLVKIGKNGSTKSQDQYNQLVNPGKTPIEPGAYAKHHISNEDLIDMATMKDILDKKEFRNFIKKRPLIAYNANFDIPLLNSEIKEYNNKLSSLDKDRIIPEITYCKVFDPYIIIQRIHPFVGARKKLVDQYRAFFGRDIEGAHDALVDAKATVDMFKYCCFYLNKYYKPPKGSDKKSLTARDILEFQFGRKIPGLKINLHPDFGYDEMREFDKSYVPASICVVNLQDGHKICKRNCENEKNDLKNLEKILTNEIGSTNWAKLKDAMPAGGLDYKWEKTARKFLNTVTFEPYAGKNQEEIINIILKESESYKNYNAVSLWIKNICIKEKDENKRYPNDLPDLEVIKKVMTQKKS